MQTWIILLRGVNVGAGKKNTVIMKDFKAMLEGIGYSTVKTYIQSGNAVFTADEMDAEIIKQKTADALEKTFGFLPQIMVLTHSELKQALENNPFPQALADPKTLSIYFLSESPKAPDIDKMNELKIASEEFKVMDDKLYFYAPDGIGRSKLAEKMERLLGVPVTARNLRSSMKILELADAS